MSLWCERLIFPGGEIGIDLTYGNPQQMCEGD
jgi:hypothetical protein